jgi:hypothetical protein
MYSGGILLALSLGSEIGCLVGYRYGGDADKIKEAVSILGLVSIVGLLILAYGVRASRKQSLFKCIANINSNVDASNNRELKHETTLNTSPNHKPKIAEVDDATVIKASHHNGFTDRLKYYAKKRDTLKTLITQQFVRIKRCRNANIKYRNLRSRWLKFVNNNQLNMQNTPVEELHSILKNYKLCLSLPELSDIKKNINELIDTYSFDGLNQKDKTLLITGYLRFPVSFYRKRLVGNQIDVMAQIVGKYSAKPKII